MSSTPKALGAILAALMALVGISAAMSSASARTTVRETLSQESIAPSCRAGVTALGLNQAAWVDDLGAGWFVFFGGFTDSVENGAQIAPVISVRQDKDGATYLDSYTVSPGFDGLLPILQAYPGMLWMVGNEVDRGPNPGGDPAVAQGDTFPDVYARAYHEVYHFIKEHDPTALVANSGLVQVTPGRLQYLDLMWQSYLDQFNETMPVDVWNMHIYILPEAELSGAPNGIANVALGTDPALAKRGPGANKSQCALDDIYCYAEHDSMAIFDEQVRAMRRWMFDHGQQNKPLILSEFSILYPCLDPDAHGNCGYLRDEFGNDFDERRVKNWLAATTTYLESASDPVLGYPADNHRLVQQWAWFSINNEGGPGDVSDLVRKSTSGTLEGLTPIGQKLRDFAATIPSYVNLRPIDYSKLVVDTPHNSDTVDVALQAIVANNGTVGVERSLQVTFYADSQLTQVIGQAEIPGPSSANIGLPGCALNTVPVSVTWTGLDSGSHPYWVKVDSENVIDEGGAPQEGENDNVAAGVVLVDPQRFWLPITGRSFYGQ